MNDFEQIKILVLKLLKHNDRTRLTQFSDWHDMDILWTCRSNGANPDILRDVVWYLCNKGIMRAGCYANSGRSGGSPENYFCLTQQGRNWLEKIDINNYVSIPQASSEFLKLFDKNIDKFGDAFKQRVAEAVECYNMQLYIACHTMTGSAIESILLYLLTTIDGITETTREEIFNDYKRGNTKKLEDNTIAKMSRELKEIYDGLCAFIKDFRNNAAHGEYAEATESSAYLALVSLYRFSNSVCKYVEK